MHIRKRTVILSVWILAVIPNGIKAQNSEYAQYVIKTLSSPIFHGRGYVNNGLDSAANFILKEFEKIQLQPFFNGYRQKFTIPVNTFPGNMSLRLNNTSLQPVREFIVDPASSGLTGKYHTAVIYKDELLNRKILNRKLKEAKDGFLVVDDSVTRQVNENEKKIANDIIRILKYDPELKIAGLLEISHEKLSWGVSTVLANRPSLITNTQIRSDNINEVEINIENQYIKDYKVSNLAGWIQGHSIPDSFILFTAHYDHLGQMGKNVFFPGANDNASGVAMILSLAGYYKTHTPDYSVAFVAFTGEEAGLLGSQYFVKNPPIDLKKIKFLINIDLAGNGEEGITVVNGSVYPDKFEKLKQINYQNNALPVIRSRGEACNSDHCFFYQAGVPCFFIYTMGGTQAYHDLDDNFDSLTLSGFNDLKNLLIEFVNKL